MRSNWANLRRSNSFSFLLQLWISGYSRIVKFLLSWLLGKETATSWVQGSASFIFNCDFFQRRLLSVKTRSKPSKALVFCCSEFFSLGRGEGALTKDRTCESNNEREIFREGLNLKEPRIQKKIEIQNRADFQWKVFCLRGVRKHMRAHES